MGMHQNTPDITENAPATGISKYKPLRGSRKQLKITRMLGDSSLTHKQIAELVGCSAAYVAKISQQLRYTLGPDDLELDEYRKLLRKKAPAGRRVDCLSTIINPDTAKSNPFSVIRAVEYVDTVLGLHPKARVEAQDQQQQAQPMFVLPAGANVQVNVIRVSPRRRVERQVSDSREIIPECDDSSHKETE